MPLRLPRSKVCANFGRAHTDRIGVPNVSSYTHSLTDCNHKIEHILRETIETQFRNLRCGGRDLLTIL